MRPASVFHIPAGTSFATALAEGAIRRHGKSAFALSEITIYLPTRRAARSFGDAFAQAFGGAALLPQFRALADVADDALDFESVEDSLEIGPAISPLRRKLLLATLVRQWHRSRRGDSLPFAHAVSHADALCGLLDEVESQGADLNDLRNLVDSALAEHWTDIRDFLFLLRDTWPGLLAAEKALNPATRRNLVLDALAVRLRDHQERPVIAAGSTGSIPATARVLKTIASLPNGAVVLPGLDLSLDAEGWEGVGSDPGHPQFGLKQLLDRLGVSREEVRHWADAPARSNPRQEILSQALRPAPTTDAWRASAANPPANVAEGFDGLALVEAADPGEEASAIALMLRRVLETPDKTAALVTPDRALARRVAVELARYGIAIDDSAGRPLAQTAAGTFLCLAAEAAASSFSPIPLLALLKHPLASGGEKRTEFLRSVRSLDLALRGPRSNPGLDGIVSALSRDAALARWFGTLAATLRPIEELMSRERSLLPALLDAHLQAAESLSTDEKKHPRIWDKESGEAAARLCDSLRQACENLPELEPSAYASLFRLLADETPVRAAFGQHPRLAILGPLEARLLSFDLMVLGGLNEGTWPRSAQIDPWLSRPMRAALGLESPERAIGRSAHDFESLAANPHVVLTRAGKVDGTQTIASRWLLRLQQFAKGLERLHQLADETRWTGIVRSLNATAPAERAGRPAVRPPVALRPRRLSVTEIETWRRDPYAIYARRILRLKRLDPLDAEIGPLERGRVIHKALEEFIRETPSELSRDATQKLIAIAEALFRKENIPDSVLTIWRPRFAHAAEWFVQQEREKRALVRRSVVEASGEMEIGAPAGAFVLRGRADRIDLLKEGGASIIDYKSGVLPSASDLVALRAPQLPLEGAMLAAGAFAGVEQLTARELVYVRFSGGGRPGEWRKIDVDAAGISARALAWLTERVARFDDERTSYISRTAPYGGGFTGDYDHLARAREWATA